MALQQASKQGAGRVEQDKGAIRANLVENVRKVRNHSQLGEALSLNMANDAAIVVSLGENQLVYSNPGSKAKIETWTLSGADRLFEALGDLFEVMKASGLHVVDSADYQLIQAAKDAGIEPSTGTDG